jgi:phage shock protein C
MENRLTRSKSDRIVAGVCAGLARYFNIDPVIVRLLFVVLVVFAGVSPLLYALLWIIIPEDGAPNVQRNLQTPALPATPPNVEQWQYDPYTGEKISK